MVSDPSRYSPRYVGLDEIPTDTTESYDTETKRRALYRAEPAFESDINGGDPIPQEDLTQLHTVAVATLATFELVQGAVSPESATLGDLVDDGERRSEYAQQFKDEYDQYVSRINNTSDEPGNDAVYYGSTSATTDSVATGTRSSGGMERRYPFRRDDRFPDD